MRLSRFMVFPIVVAAVSHAGGGALFSQQRQQEPGQGEEVVRVRADLVQTDVMVFGKDGAFVDGLRREQFELKVNGKPREISFFERIAAGSQNEEAQLAAARGLPRPGGSSDGDPVPLDRGRTIFFFLDDIHLSPSSISQARSLLTRFVDHEMRQNDEAAIRSATGQIGFLQQLTNNKAVLRAAIARLKPRPYSVLDNDRPTMSEYQAELIESNDREVITYFVDYLLRENIPMDIAASMVRARATQILAQAGHLTTSSLASLDNLARSCSQLPGRKLIFVISDGFYLNGGNSDAVDRIRAVTSAAARSGIVIYSIDARGLVTPAADASMAGNFDPAGRLQRASSGELAASQDALNALARDTGGRALFNSNAIVDAIPRALKETSIYYLVAWRPENDEERSGKVKRIDVNVVQRPELTVRLRRKFVQTEAGTPVAPKTKETPARTANTQLSAALRSEYPKDSLPTSLAVSFVNLPDPGSVLAITMQAITDANVFSLQDGKRTANVGVAGAILDDQGKSVGGFRERLTITATSADVKLPATNNLQYNYRVSLKPGLYQVRVAAYDEKTGRVGSASDWIEVPDLAARRLALSSVLVGERIGGGDAGGSSSGSPGPTATPGVLRSNIDRRFARPSRLRFLIFTYNAANGQAASDPTAATPPRKSAPDVAIQLQVLRDDEPVITTTLRKIDTEEVADLARLPYSAEIHLQDLPPGRYLLKVTVIDRIAKTSASQQVGFWVD